MTSSEMNPLYQQMGELLGSMKALHDKVDFRHAQAEKQGEAVQAEMRNIKHDQRDLEQKLDGAVYVVKNDVDALKAASGVTSRALDELTAAVSALKKPVEEIMALRARAMGVLLAHLIHGMAGIRRRVSRKLLIAFTDRVSRPTSTHNRAAPHPPCPMIRPHPSSFQPSAARSSPLPSMAAA